MRSGGWKARVESAFRRCPAPRGEEGLLVGCASWWGRARRLRRVGVRCLACGTRRSASQCAARPDGGATAQGEWRASAACGGELRARGSQRWAVTDAQHAAQSCECRVAARGVLLRACEARYAVVRCGVQRGMMGVGPWRAVCVDGYARREVVRGEVRWACEHATSRRGWQHAEGRRWRATSLDGG